MVSDVALASPPGNLPPVPDSSASSSSTLIVAIFTDPGAADHLLQKLAEQGGLGATVLDGRGLSEHLASQVSLFAGFKAGFAAVGHSRVVLSVVPTARAAEILEVVRTCGDLDQPGTGLAFAIALAGVVGVGVARST